MMIELGVGETVRHAGRAMPGLKLRSLFHMARRFVICAIAGMPQSKIGARNMRSDSFMGICFMGFFQPFHESLSMALCDHAMRAQRFVKPRYFTRTCHER